MSSQPNLPDTAESRKAWSIYGLRLTAFLSPAAEFDPSNWRNEIVGDLPEAEQGNPRLFQKTEVYPYKNGKLILDTNPGRIDWRYTSIQDPMMLLPHSLDNFWADRECIEEFLVIVNRWFALGLPVVRIAFGTAMGIPVDDRAAGYQVLDQYLPAVQLDPFHSSDFQYQINRSRQSVTIPNLMINRLSKWSTQVATVTTLDIATNKPVGSKIVSTMAHLELDINTSADHRGPFESDQLEPQYLELKTLAMEIAEEGDIP
jgi:hypothetical protein